MNAQESLEKIEAGQYSIEYIGECGCYFDWDIRDGSLDDGVSTDYCWEGYGLFVDGEIVAEWVRYEAPNVLLDGLEVDDITDDIWEQMRMSNILQRGESANCEEHNHKRREALVEWLMDCGYGLDRDDERGFANEYTMILRDFTQSVKNSREDCERWADEFLYEGDPTTEAFVGFSLEE